MSQQKPNRNREILTVNVGGCGVNLGQTSLEQYCVEQGISTNADKECKTQHDNSIPISFMETSKGKYYARSLFVDLDPYSINMAKNLYAYNKVLNNRYLINGKSSASDIFARAHYVDGKEIIDRVNDKVRLMVEECDSIQGFIINHSLAGGTGGGVGMLILERLAVDYRKKCKFAFEVFHDETKLTAPVQVYNTLFSMHWSLDHTEASIILDNSQLYRICRRNLGIIAPKYKHYNNVYTKLMSNITAPFRFGLPNDDLMTFAKDMTPFPRLHYLTTSLSPIIAKSNDKDKAVVYKDDIQSLTDQCTDSVNFFHHCADFDGDDDKYMAITFNYRGYNINNSVIQANDTMEWMRLINKKSIGAKFSLVKWSSTDKASLKYINSAPVALPTDNMIIGDKQVAMIGNNTCISRLFEDRICKRYDMLYSQRAYVHFYVGWGMEEGEFAEAREDLGFLQMDYRDVLTDQQDEDNEEDLDNDENV